LSLLVCFELDLIPHDCHFIRNDESWVTLLGVFERYVDEVFRHMWAEPKKMDDPDVVRASLDGSGLDGKRLLELAETPEIKNRLIENTQRSVNRGTFGAPTFFVGDEIFFGKDRLRDVEESIREFQRTSRG